MSDCRNKRKVLRKRKYHQRAEGNPSNLYIQSLEYDWKTDTSSDDGRETSKTKASEVSEKTSTPSESSSATLLQTSPIKSPDVLLYSPNFRKLFSTESNEGQFLSATTSSCSTLPDLIIEPAGKKRKISEDNLNLKKIMNFSERIREKYIEKDWKGNYSKFIKKYFVLSYCKGRGGETKVRKFCEECTLKAEGEIEEKGRNQCQKLSKRKARKARSD